MTHVSDLDRDRAVELVQQAYADGRLDPAELEVRLERALTATSSQELAPVVADLPGDEPVRLESTGGRLTREGDWQVPRRLRVDSEYGNVRLDLSRAHVPYARVEIELRLAYGRALIILPAGASADTDGVRTEWGRVTCKVAGRPRQGGLHVQITGELPYGRLTVRDARR
ncbi:DUF1707 SHOCT-like domain-containing protein [Nonomuraea gerenzanensis]|uniref:DUF1707 domain-containing protein n=1 Tax=Nonomuraea gerenzanensis TaxID=93944 RepID=A0A1M4EDW5_9ACTN|nr:DUF1707 domain-containing protein [Nonomuraea gerenzanensis]UBU08717.1 DUF1707 domain-containing protein [Nonomuraea gerenzanensis]SBO97079.1 hypothetical protein BN4615_P6595 [Nonomuraea gerenzanensis]